VYRSGEGGKSRRREKIDPKRTSTVDGFLRIAVGRFFYK